MCNISWKHQINDIPRKQVKVLVLLQALTLGTAHYSSKHLPLAHPTVYLYISYGPVAWGQAAK